MSVSDTVVVAAAAAADDDKHVWYLGL